MNNAVLHANNITKDELINFITKIERLEQDKAEIAEDIREVYAEAKGNGYDIKIMRKCIALRKKDTADIQEEQSILSLYLQAIGVDIDITAV